MHLTNPQRKKGKEMLKKLAKSTPNKDKGNDNDKDSKGGKTAAKKGGIAPTHAQRVQRRCLG